jgi:hypothetical protein
MVRSLVLAQQSVNVEYSTSTPSGPDVAGKAIAAERRMRPLCAPNEDNSTPRLSVQRRARRAHRKRVAQITCRKWMAFAESRLRAYRHHRRKLLIAGVWAFRRACEQSSRSARNAMVLRSRILYRQTSEVLHAWSVTAQRLRHLTRALTDWQTDRAAGVAARALRWWRTYVLQQHYKQRLNCKAAFFRSFILTSNAVRAMQAHVQRQRHKARQHACATMHAQQLMRQRAWSAWRSFVAIRAHKARLGAIASAHCQHMQCKAMLCGWQSAASVQISARAAWLERLHAVRRELDASLLGAVVEAWAVAKRAAQLKRAAAEVRGQHLQSLQRLVWDTCAPQCHLSPANIQSNSIFRSRSASGFASPHHECSHSQVPKCKQLTAHACAGGKGRHCTCNRCAAHMLLHLRWRPAYACGMHSSSGQRVCESSTRNAIACSARCACPNWSRQPMRPGAVLAAHMRLRWQPPRLSDRGCPVHLLSGL